MKNNFQLIFIIFFLTGCAGSPIYNSFIAPGEIQDTLDYWKGKPIDDAINHYGPPDNVTETNDYKYYKWGVTSGKGFCNWWVKVNSNHIIEDADANGRISQCYGAVAFKK